jgi:hypothetical protein
MKTQRLLIAVGCGLGLTLALALAFSAGREARAAAPPRAPAPSLHSPDPAGEAQPARSDADAGPGIPDGLSAAAWAQIVGQVRRDRRAFIHQTAKITATDGMTNDYFAYAVAVDGDTVVVGAYGDDGNSGAAYVFARNWGGADNWGQTARMTATGRSTGDLFGVAVAIDGDTVVVGAPGEDADTGAAYVFTGNTGGADRWGQAARISATLAAAGDRFGSAVAIDGDTVVVGASGTSASSGAAYVFARNAGGAENWGQTTAISTTDGAVSDLFGSAVALDGDTLVVGATFGDGALSDSGAVYVFARNAGGADNWGQTDKITTAGGIAGDRFGYAVALDGGTLVVGAPGEDALGSDSGAAYVFARNVGGPDNWGQAARITATDGAAGDWFGWAVAVAVDTVLVGAPYDDDDGPASGSTYVLGRNAGGANHWGQTTKITAADGVTGNVFGYAVAMEGDTLLIGAYGDGDNGPASGSAHVFARGGATWEEESTPMAEDGGDYFGYAVALDGDTLVVGVPYDDENGANAGAAYIYTRNEGGADNWGQTAKISATGGLAWDRFGYAVDIDGDTVVVGANSDEFHTSTPGAAYVFARNAGGADGWGQTAKITVTDATVGDQFGSAVGVDGNVLVVGAPFDDDNGSNSGSAYVFARNAGGADAWGLMAQITATDAITGDHLGNAVAISGDIVVVAASGDDANGVNSGSVYVFGRNEGGADNWGQAAHISPADPAVVDFFGIAVDVDGDTIVVGSYDDDDACPWNPNCNSGSAYVFTRNAGGADNWGQTAKITASDSITYDQFGGSIALDGDTVIVGAVGDDDNGEQSGSAYVFARNVGGADNWGQVVKLTASNGTEDDRFGIAVALAGDVAVVGAWYFDGIPGNRGLTYLYRETLFRALLPAVMRSPP